jgi:hypothetical protein
VAFYAGQGLSRLSASSPSACNKIIPTLKKMCLFDPCWVICVFGPVFQPGILGISRQKTSLFLYVFQKNAFLESAMPFI